MDKELSKIKHIMGKYYYIPKSKAPLHIIREIKLNKLLGLKNKETLETFAGISPESDEHKERMSVFQYFYKLGKTDKEIELEWYGTQWKRRSQSSEYKKKPIKERKDNQNPLTNTINWGSGGSNRNRIRVPSKKHKNRFKNFLKLFPSYKG